MGLTPVPDRQHLPNHRMRSTAQRDLPRFQTSRVSLQVLRLYTSVRYHSKRDGKFQPWQLPSRSIQSDRHDRHPARPSPASRVKAISRLIELILLRQVPVLTGDATTDGRTCHCARTARSIGHPEGPEHSPTARSLQQTENLLRSYSPLPGREISYSP